MEYKVVLHQEYEELKKNSEQYTEKLSGLIEEYSYIISHEYNKTLTEYILKIGTLEYEEFQIYTKIESLKRRIQLITAFSNCEEDPNINAIDEQVDKEFKDYYKKLQSMEEDLEIAKILENTEFLSKEDDRELKTLYKNLVKKLHPDVNLNVAEKDKTLWMQALEAYQKGDLEMIYTLTDTIDIKDNDPLNTEIENALEIVRGKCERLKERIEKYILKIAEINNTFPFNKNEFLKDELQVKERQSELKESIERLIKYYSQLKLNTKGKM